MRLRYETVTFGCFDENMREWIGEATIEIYKGTGVRDEFGIRDDDEWSTDVTRWWGVCEGPLGKTYYEEYAEATTEQFQLMKDAASEALAEGTSVELPEQMGHQETDTELLSGYMADSVIAQMKYMANS